jgi:glycosyltransferase involved in cell wall biosynthesis
MLLRHAPLTWRVLLVGVDGKGDCKLCEITRLDLGGRTIDFLPMIYFPDDEMHKAASALAGSLTLRFAISLVRNFLRLRTAIGEGAVTVELERFEFAIVPFVLGKPTVQVIHGEGSKQDKMDSLIKKYWLVHRTSEEIAIRLASAIVCVNPNIEAQVKRRLPRRASSVAFMAVPVDTDTFQVRDFDTRDGIFRVVFAGRLDEFKDPPTMFRSLREVHDRLGGRVEFHYIGTSDPHRYSEFALIEHFTTAHGYKNQVDVAAIIARCHAGVLTSYFEGMPCYLLEVVSVGRPVVAIRLPQYDLVIEENVSGAMIERCDDGSSTVDGLTERFLAIWSRILQGQMHPNVIHAKAEPFSIKNQLDAHFARHSRLTHSA